MAAKAYQPGEPFQFQLTIKTLLKAPLIYSPDQEIVYRDKARYTYRQTNQRIHRLANVLETLGLSQGETVAVFDYNSNRYLELFFTVPMIGAVLQTVNWRLSAEQLRYTINHAEARIIIINSVFLPILAKLHPQLETVKTIVAISEDGAQLETDLPLAGEYEALLQNAPKRFDFPDLDENTKATTFYTTGTTGDPKGVHFSHRQLLLHTLSNAIAFGSYNTIGRFRSNDVYMPRCHQNRRRWVSSLDLKNLMSQHEAVLESAAIGIPDEKWGERPLMLVVLKKGFEGKVSAEDLKKHMRQCAEAGKLPKYGVPERYTFVPEIAKTSVGKLNKKQLRQTFTS